jgi:hypothetical protein
MKQIKIESIKTKTDFKNIIYVYHNWVNAKLKKPLYLASNIDTYNNMSIITVYNNFVSVFNTTNVRLMSENLQRKSLITYIHSWILRNLKYYIQMRPSVSLQLSTPTKPVVIPEPEPEVITEPVVIPEPEPEVITEPDVIPEPEPEPVVIPEPEPETVVIPEPEPEVITEPDVIPEPEPEVITEPDVIPEPEPEVITEPDVIPEPEPEVITEPDVIPEPEPEVITEPYQISPVKLKKKAGRPRKI